MEGKKIFRNALNGYNKSDVNEFIDHLSEKFRHENDDLKEKITALEFKINEQNCIILEKQKLIDESKESLNSTDTLNKLLYGQAEPKPQPVVKTEPTEKEAKAFYSLNYDANKIIKMAEEEANLIKKQLQIKLLSTENSYYETKYKLRNLTEKIEGDISEINKSIDEFKTHIEQFTIPEILHNKYDFEEEYSND